MSSTLRCTQKMSCMYTNLWAVSLLVLLNPLQLLKQLLFSLKWWKHNKCGGYAWHCFECCWVCLWRKAWNITKRPSCCTFLLIMRGCYASKRILLTPFAFNLWFLWVKKSSKKPIGLLLGCCFHRFVVKVCALMCIFHKRERGSDAGGSSAMWV